MSGGVNGDEVIKHVGKRRVRISGRFFPNGAGAIDNTQNQGKTGWTVARNATGQFILALDRRYLKVYPIADALQLSAPAVRILQWGTETLVASGSGSTLVLNCIDATGTAQDIAANANNSIGFELEAVQDTVIG